MQVQKYVGQHAQRAIAGGVVVLVAEDRSVDLGLCRILQPFNLFFRLCGMSVLRDCDVVFNSGRRPRSRPLAVSVSVPAVVVLLQPSRLTSVARFGFALEHLRAKAYTRKESSRIVELTGLSLRPLSRAWQHPP